MNAQAAVVETMNDISSALFSVNLCENLGALCGRPFLNTEHTEASAEIETLNHLAIESLIPGFPNDSIPR